MNTRKVLVIDAEGKPLLPTHPARAHHLLEAGKTTVLQMGKYYLVAQLAECIDYMVIQQLTGGIFETIGGITVDM